MFVIGERLYAQPVYVYVCMYVCLCVCIYIYIYIYIYIILVLSSLASTASTRTECGSKAPDVFNSQQYQMRCNCYIMQVSNKKHFTVHDVCILFTKFSPPCFGRYCGHLQCNIITTIQNVTMCFKWINQRDATISQVSYLTCMYSSTCFGTSSRPSSGAQQLQ